MKETITEILWTNAEDGKVRRRDIASFALLLIAPVVIVGGAIAGPGGVQQSMALAAALALVVSLRLTVKPAGGARAVYLVGAATAALTFAAGVAAPFNGGILALEPACTGLLVSAAALFAARLNSHRPAVASAPAPSAC
jgi:hypothetical protein